MSKPATHFGVMHLSKYGGVTVTRACKTKRTNTANTTRTDPRRVACKRCRKYIDEHPDLAAEQVAMENLEEEIRRLQTDYETMLEHLPEEVPK